MRAIDRLNPAARVVLGLVLTMPLVVTIDWVSASVALVLEVVVLVAAGVRVGMLARRSLPLVFIGLMGALSMVLYGEPGGRTHWHWGPMAITDHSIALAAAMFIRVFALALPAIALLTGVDATRMADGLAQVLRLPARFVLGSLAGFRLLGLLQQDWRTLAQARRARGLGDGGRVRRLSLMSFALLVFAIRRGSKLATAMEARGFGMPGATRTWARPSRLGWADLVGLLVVLAIDTVALWAAWRAGTLWTVFS